MKTAGKVFTAVTGLLVAVSDIFDVLALKDDAGNIRELRQFIRNNPDSVYAWGSSRYLERALLNYKHDKEQTASDAINTLGFLGMFFEALSGPAGWTLLAAQGATQLGVSTAKMVEN